MAFEDNLSLLAKKQPDLAKAIKGFPPSEWQFFKTGKKGEINLTNNAYFIHSDQNIEIEARQWSSMHDLQEVDWLVIYGIGLGYYYEELKPWLKDPKHRLIFIEDDLGVLQKLLELDSAKNLLEDSQVEIYYVDWNEPFQKTLSTIARRLIYQHILFSALTSYEVHKPEVASKCQFLLKFQLYRAEMTIGEYLERGSAFYGNFYKNLFEYPYSLLGNSLYGKFKNIPAIICGAGPSLQKNIEVLKTLKDRALILAGGTAMNALNAYGFVPHFGIGVDPFPAHFTRLLMNIAFETPFFYRNRMNFNATRMIHGNKLYLPGATGYSLPNWFDDKLGLSHPPLDEGCNVINMSLSIARELGCNPIICVGLDLAYSFGQSYSPGIELHAIHDPKEHFITKTAQEELVLQNDVNGQPIFTLWKWIQEAAWFSNFASTYPETTIINATEGGIGFFGIPNVGLSEFSEVSLLKQYDFETLLHGQMLAIPMPETVNLQTIQKVVAEFASSLNRTAKILQSIYDYNPKLWGQKYVDPNVDPKLLEFEEELKNELAYQQLLKVFDESFVNYVKTSLEDQQNPNTLLDSLSGRYQYLLEISVENLKFIEHALDRQARLYFRRPKPKTDAANVHPKGCSYKIEGDFFFIEDPELGISLKEALPKEKAEQSLPGSPFKLVQYFEANRLHGPSTLYGNEGQVLAESVYLHGKKIGRMQAYYTDGALHSVRKFQDGLMHGIQEYYYEDGQTKSLISYQHGALSGCVKLFYANGQIQRELHFKNGLRDGLDRFYNEFGNIEIEAEYQEGKPVRSARQWYTTGTLAKEIIFSAPGKIQQIRRFDSSGKEIPDSARQLDYFEKMIEETERLQLALNQIIDKLDEALKELAKENKFDEEINQDLVDLKKRLEEFKKLGEKLQKESGLKDEGEPLWKTPSSKRLIQQYLELMTGSMKDTLVKIKTEFNEIQKRIKKQ